MSVRRNVSMLVLAGVSAVGVAACSDSKDPVQATDDGIKWKDIEAAPGKLSGDLATAKLALCQAQDDLAASLVDLDQASEVVDVLKGFDGSLAALAVLSSDNAPGPVVQDADDLVPLFERGRDLINENTTKADLPRIALGSGFRFGQARASLRRLQTANLACE